MQDQLSRPGFKNTKRILVKIGSRVLNTGKDLNYRVIERICDDLSMLKDRGMDIGIVSSGAIAAGNALLGIRDSNISLSKKQALAAI
ncbi:MAG: glutamate 5-kinase, partial [Deltaproteobacteria bacterium]|nr:glutamate 5-kinase [Deltaproteobacteria bacterium]